MRWPDWMTSWHSLAAEILSTRCLHDEAPSSLAPFDLARLKGAQGDIVTKCAESLLPEPEAGMLRDFEYVIAKPIAEQLACLRAPDYPRPYWESVWDPVLASDKKGQHLLYRRLLDAGVLSPRKRI
eukprot:5660892-Amphidinium_carterae.1